MVLENAALACVCDKGNECEPPGKPCFHAILNFLTEKQQILLLQKNPVCSRKPEKLVLWGDGTYEQIQTELVQTQKV